MVVAPPVQWLILVQPAWDRSGSPTSFSNLRNIPDVIIKVSPLGDPVEQFPPHSRHHPQPFRTFLVEAQHPIPKGLAANTRHPGSLEPARTVVHYRQGKLAPAWDRIAVPPGQSPKHRSIEISSQLNRRTHLIPRSTRPPCSESDFREIGNPQRESIGKLVDMNEQRGRPLRESSSVKSVAVRWCGKRERQRLSYAALRGPVEMRGPCEG